MTIRRTALSLALLLAFGGAVLAADIDGKRLENAAKEPQNWMTYHGD